MAKVGDIRTWNFQSDIYGGRYRLVEDLGNGRWVAEHLEPTDEEIEKVLADVTPGWDGSEAFQEREALERIEQAGTTFTIEIVSRAQWDRMF